MAHETYAPCTKSGQGPDEASLLRQQNADLKKRLSIFIDASRRISGSLDTDTVLEEVIDSARSLTGARYGVLLTCDERNGVRNVFTSGMTSEERGALESSPTGQGLLGYLNEIEEPLRLADIASHPESVGFPENHPPMRTFLGMQIRNRGERVGNIFLTEKEAEQEFTVEDEETIVMLASLAGTAISNARIYEQELRAKADMEALVNIAPVGVAVFDAKTGAMVSYNPEIKRLLTDHSMVDTPWEEIFPLLSFYRFDGREVPLGELPLNRVFLFGETVRAEEIVVKMPDGTSLPSLVNGAPIYSEQGEIIAAMIVVQDMTPLVDMERVRAEFLGQVSEELRLPLTTIKGSVAALSDIAGSGNRTELNHLVEIIDQQTDLMRSQVNSLVELTYIETGTLTVSPEAADAQSLVDEAIREFQRGHSGINIASDIPANLPLVMADKKRIGQVLNNLLYSAARHSADLSGIEVIAARIDVYVSVSVSAKCDGAIIGGASSLLQRMIGSHVEAVGNTDGGGKLALALCKGIVEAHGGRMRVEHEDHPGGMTITFTIPAAEELAEESEEDISGYALPPERNGSHPGEKARILVATDDPRMLGIVRRTISKDGYTPINAGDYEQVALIVEEEKPNLLLLDLSAHPASGFELTRHISSVYGVPVIVLSGQGDDENIERAFETGADDYIVKPFSPTELVARIKASLRKRDASRLSEPLEGYRLEDVSIDYTGRTVTVAGQPVHMTATEYDLLVELSTKAGRVITQDELLQRVWGPEYTGESQLLRSYVKSLRQKLGDNARTPTYIFTEHGIGYRMRKP